MRKRVWVWGGAAVAASLAAMTGLSAAAVSSAALVAPAAPAPAISSGTAGEERRYHPSDMPKGYELIIDDTSAPAPADQLTKVLHYALDGDIERGALVVVETTTPYDAATVDRGFRGRGAAVTSVRGRSAYRMSDGGADYSIRWLEEPGVLLTVSGHNVERGVVESVAAKLVRR